MKNASIACTLIAALAGCDARVDEDYRGESLLRINGSLLLSEGELSGDLVPALAFRGADTPTLQLLDVDTSGEFPASFTLDVMSPPPAAAIRTPEGVPGYAIGYITALPPQHPAVFDYSRYLHLDGAGGFSWCENPPDNTDCYRTIEQCIAGTDECYRELARCKNVPEEGGPEGSTIEVCDEILEQSGDPKIAYPWSDFVGFSENYFLLYMTSAAPAGAARAYLANGYEDAQVPFVFGQEPITAGYHLVRTRLFDEQELSVQDACGTQVENEQIALFNQAHGTNYATVGELIDAIAAAGGSIDDDPDFRALEVSSALAFFDAGCARPDLHFELVDPSSTSIEVTLGKRDQFPLQ